MVNSRWLNTDEAHSAVDQTLASKVKQCYNNITVNTNNITLENTDSGVSKTVAVTGGGSSSTTIAYNSVSVSGNDLVFGKTDGSVADTQTLGNLTAITDLEALTTNIKNLTGTSTLKTTVDANTNDITDIKDLTGSSTLKTTVDDSLKSIEIDTNGGMITRIRVELKILTTLLYQRQ